jgi:hypothetical protein
MRVALISTLVLLCFAWLHAAADEPTVTSTQIVTKVRLTTDRIEYSGIITNEANAGTFELYAGAQPKPRTILIESQGGSAGAGMELGSWIFENGIDVEIDTYCFSSCANYVFPAGRTKLLAPRASLMWHGGVTQPITAEELGQVLESTLADMGEEERQGFLASHPRSELLQQLQQSLTDIVARERDFFEKIGVDQRITVLGHLYERELLQGKGYYIGWDYSLEDLERLGVHAIEIKGDEPWAPACPIVGQQIYRIRLDDLPAFRPRP